MNLVFLLHSLINICSPLRDLENHQVTLLQWVQIFYILHVSKLMWYLWFFLCLDHFTWHVISHVVGNGKISSFSQAHATCLFSDALIPVLAAVVGVGVQMYFGQAISLTLKLYSGFLDYRNLFLFLYYFVAETPYCFPHGYTNLHSLFHILANIYLSSFNSIGTDVRSEVTVT